MCNHITECTLYLLSRQSPRLKIDAQTRFQLIIFPRRKLRVCLFVGLIEDVRFHRNVTVLQINKKYEKKNIKKSLTTPYSLPFTSLPAMTCMSPLFLVVTVAVSACTRTLAPTALMSTTVRGSTVNMEHAENRAVIRSR